MRHITFIYLLTALSIMVSSCTKADETLAVKNPCTVAFRAGHGIDIMTRTVIGDDGVSVLWEPSDKVYLWAKKTDMSYAFSCQEFYIYGMADSFAYFSSVLDSPMAEGTYTYYCCSPSPDIQNLNSLCFTLPVVQDGKGKGIMLAEPVKAGALKTLDEYVETESLSMSMEQMAHLLQIYLIDNENLLGGEKLKKAVLTFPSSVVGSYSVNLNSPQSGLTEILGSKVLTLELSEGLPLSKSAMRKYAYACIAPNQWQTSDAIGVKLYTDTKVAEGKEIKLKGRNMQKGHATPVRLEPSQIKNFCHLDFTFASNPIGEGVYSITMTAPEGCKWGDTGTNVYQCSYIGEIPVGTSFSVGYEEESIFRNLSGKTVNVTYESEHLKMSSSFTIPNLDGKYSSSISLNVPWILNENFNNVSTFSSNDEYKTSKAGSYSGYSFLNGWSGGRIGAEAGKCIRIGCRRETSSDYDARVDSAPLNCTFKKATDINVAFSYGSNNKYGGIAIVTDGNVGQNCYVGYVTNTKTYKSGDSDGTFDRDNNSFYTKEYSGSYSNTPNDTDYTIKGIPAGTSPVRITWHTEVEHQAGTTNTTAWLYIDNVVVTVAK